MSAARVLHLGPAGLRFADAPQGAVPAPDTGTAEAWQAAISRLLPPSPGRRADLRVEVDDRLAMAVVIEGAVGGLSDAGMQAAARAWFAHRLGPAHGLALRTVPQRDAGRLLACGLPAALVEGVRTAAAQAGMRLTGLAPAWVSRLAAAERMRLPPLALVVAPGAAGLLAIGLRVRGSWRALGLEPCPLAVLPDDQGRVAMAWAERQAARGALDPAALAGLHRLWLTPAGTAAPDGWRQVESADTRRPAGLGSSWRAALGGPPAAFALGGLDFCAARTAAAPWAGRLVAAAGVGALCAAALQAGQTEQRHAAAAAALAAQPTRQAVIQQAAVPMRPAPPAELQAVQDALARPLLPALDALAAARQPGIALTRLAPGRATDTPAAPAGRLMFEVAAQADSAEGAAGWVQALAGWPGLAAARLKSIQPDPAGRGVRLELEVWHGPH